MSTATFHTNGEAVILYADHLAALVAKQTEIAALNDKLLGMATQDELQQREIDALTAQVAELAVQLGKDRDLIEQQLAEAQATIAALQWQPITMDNLPLKDSEVIGRDGLVETVRYHSDLLRQSFAYSRMVGWTHFRAISPPAPARAAEPKGETCQS